MSTRFYYGQKDYIVQLNLMDDVATASATSAAGQATLAQKWATQATGEVVTGQGYSAYYWAQQASGSAATAATALSNVGWNTTGTGPLLANWDDATVPAGMYYINSSTIGTIPNGMTTGVVLHKVYGAAGWQLASDYSKNLMYFRRRGASTWYPWQTIANLDSPAFTGTPTAPTAATGTNTTQVATTAFAQSAITATGVGATDSASPIADLDATTLGGGLYNTNTATTVGTSWPTGSALNGFVMHRVFGTAGFQMYQPYTTDRLFFRRRYNSTWNQWNEIAPIASPTFTGTPSAPTAAVGDNTTALATTAFTQAALAANGLGIASSTTFIADLDSFAQGAGVYYVNSSSTVGTFPTGTAISGAVLHKVYGSGGFQLFSAMGSDRMFFRRRVGNVWQAWNEVANLNSPVFTGDPQAPTPAIGDNDTSIATTSFVNSMINAIYAKSVAGGSQVTLTAVEAAYPMIKLTGALTANINVVVPSAANRFIIWNATTGAFTVTVKTSAGTGLVVTQGTTSSLMCDGTNVMDANNDTANIALTGVPTTPDATTGTSTSQIANTKFVTTGLATKADLAGNATQDFASKNLTAVSMNNGPLAGFRNLIINGRMQIDQRNEGNVLTLAANSSGFSADRWKCINTRASGTISFQRINTGSVRSFWLKSLNNTATTLAAGDNVALFQCIEGFSLAGLNWGTAAAKAITVSFWVNASITGTYAVAFRNGGVNRSYVATFTVSAANTDQLVTLTIPGDTTGTWTNGSGAGLYMSFDLGVGSTYNTSTYGAWQAGNFFGGTTTVKLTGTANATFNTTEVQMEVGPQATPYEALPIGVELARCQRFYAKTFAQGVAPAGNAGSGGALFFSGTGNISFWGASWRYPVTMRTAPTLAFYNVATGGAGWRDISINADSVATTVSPGDAGVFVLANNGTAYSAGAGSAYYIHVTAEAEL